VNLDAALLEILACPACKSPLEVDDPAGELVCTNPECALAYPVRDDIPVLLVDEARKPGSADASDAADSATTHSADSAGPGEPAAAATTDAAGGADSNSNPAAAAGNADGTGDGDGKS
jgi:uncharacterized protein